MTNPDKIYGPKLAELFQKYCELILKESGATSMRVEAVFTCSKSKLGELKTKTFVTPDSKTERMLDPDRPMRRGAKLQQEVSLKLKNELKSLRKGGKQ